MKTTIALVVLTIGLVGCAGAGKMSDRKADVSYATPNTLATAPLQSGTEGIAMFPVAKLPEGKIEAPSILPPGSVLQAQVQKKSKK